MAALSLMNTVVRAHACALPGRCQAESVGDIDEHA